MHTAGPYTVALVGDTFWVQAPVGHGMARLAIIDDGAGTKPRENAHLFAASPDMLAALLSFERAAQLSNTCEDATDAVNEWLEASDDAMAKCNAVLMRLRDAGVIAKTEESA